MHTNGFLTALATELTKLGNSTIGQLASADLHKVRMRSAKSRAVYYDGRYEGII